eukprot:6183173-Pleurochrysis_carterae.AAC.3
MRSLIRLHPIRQSLQMRVCTDLSVSRAAIQQAERVTAPPSTLACNPVHAAPGSFTKSWS